MDTSFVLPPESPVGHNRNTRQVSYCMWALARHTRRISGRLRVQATQLLRDSQALVEEYQHRRVQGRT